MILPGWAVNGQVREGKVEGGWVTGGMMEVPRKEVNVSLRAQLVNAGDFELGIPESSPRLARPLSPAWVNFEQDI